MQLLPSYEILLLTNQTCMCLIPHQSNLNLSGETTEKWRCYLHQHIILLILAFGIGRGVVAGCAALGVGAVCVYGSGLTQSVGVREKSM